MLENITGTDFLASGLNTISQGMLIPVMVLLLIFITFAVIVLGGFIYEFKVRKTLSVSEMKNLIRDISLADSEKSINNILISSKLPISQKECLKELVDSAELSQDARESLANKIIESEHNDLDRRLEKTDIVARIGPTLGLMGTLIPMGPGLAALGSGDINVLAQAIIVAFDTTVVGIASGGIGYIVSKIRKRWYDEYLTNLETLCDAVLDFFKVKG